jgi:hypothetical protein
MGDARSRLFGEAAIAVVSTITAANAALEDILRTNLRSWLALPELVAHATGDGTHRILAIFFGAAGDLRKSAADWYVIGLIAHDYLGSEGVYGPRNQENCGQY